MSAGFTFDAGVITEALKNIYEKNFNPMTDIESRLFFEFWDKLNFATNTGLTQSGVNVEDEFRHALRYNNGVFAAFKTHRLQNDMAAFLLDSNGVRRPFKEWVKDAKPIADHQVYTWLKTEYVTAINRATHAANRKQFMSVSAILPNLEWRPSTAADPREIHRLFYGLILPAEHPFWLEHSPGDDWNCQCRLSATDADRTPEDQIPVSLRKAAEGLDNNPAKDGKLFSDSHPYIAHAYKGAEEAVQHFMQNQITARMKELRRDAKPLTEKEYENPAVHIKMSISNKGIKEWLNQPHKHQYIKNELLLDMEELIKGAVYVGKGVDKHDISIKAHLFEIDIMGDKSWIIVREFTDGKSSIHSISDSANILKIIKK